MSATFSLPMVTTFRVTEKGNCFVAHDIEFDIVVVSPSLEHAIGKLRETVKQHVEHGLRNGWGSTIRQRAPEEFLEDMPTSMKRLDPILIDHSSMAVYGAIIENRHRSLHCNA